VEYIAFGLLLIGVLFIAFGLLATKNNGNNSQSRTSNIETNAVYIPKAENRPEAQSPPPLFHMESSEQNPSFFQKQAWLYQDFSINNSYDGAKSTFHIVDTSNIKRFGNGNLYYDGFALIFVYKNGKERFDLNNLEYLSFYPNCIALSMKSQSSTSLIFVDTTSEIKKILETFQTSNVIKQP